MTRHAAFATQHDGTKDDLLTFPIILFVMLMLMLLLLRRESHRAASGDAAYNARRTAPCRETRPTTLAARRRVGRRGLQRSPHGAASGDAAYNARRTAPR